VSGIFTGVGGLVIGALLDQFLSGQTKEVKIDEAKRHYGSICGHGPVARLREHT
jgi:hypothetical protein